MILKLNSSLSRQAIFLIPAAIVAALLLVATAPSHANHRPAPISASAVSDSGFVADKGKFRIMVNGQQVGKEEFEIGPSGSDWVAHGTSEIQAPKGSFHVTGTLNLKPDGTPARYEWSTDGPKKASSVIVFNGVVANVELRVDGARPYTQQFTFSSPRIVVLDNNLYHQYAILFRLYDWDKKGVQTFSVLVPQEITPGSITVESVGKQDVGGASLEELRVKTEDNEIDAFFDGPKLMRLLAPSANAEIIRE
ncbi:MAG: hypothetical protein WCD43_02700 [Candidatus Acidiferrales bacterium]